MKHSIYLNIYICLIVLLLPVPAMANGEKDITQNEKSFALSHLTPSLRNACLSDYAHKQEMYSRMGRKQPSLDLTSGGDMVYSEPVTRSVRNVLFWDGAQSGVAFVIPVTSEAKNSNIACFYAVQGQNLKFQLSQLIF